MRKLLSVRILLLVLICYWYPQPIIAREGPGYLVKQLTNNEGLSANNVTDLALDTNGFLWIGTHGGLSRYDGSGFKTYSSSNSVLVTDRVSRIAALKNGKIFIKPGVVPPYIYSVNSHYQIVAEKNINAKDYIIFGCTGHPIPLAGLFAQSSRQSIREIASLDQFVPVDDREVYYFTNQMVEWVDVQTHKRKEIARTPLVHAVGVADIFLGLDSFNHCTLLKHGEPLGEADQSVSFRRMLAHIREQPSGNTALYRNNGAGKCLLNYGNEVWIIYQKHGVLYADLLFENVDFGQISTVMLYDEPNGILYIGSFTKGLFIVQKNPFETLLLSKDDPIKNNIYAQLAISSNWVLNRYFRYNPLTQAVAPLKSPLEPTALYRNGNKIWYSTTTAIIVADSNLIIRDSIPFADNNEFNLSGAFLEDDDHNMWFTSMHSLNCIRHHRVVPVAGADSQYFNGSKISALFQPGKDILWIGHETGLSAYNKKLNRMTPEVLLSGANVRNIYRARDGSIWVGTYGRGFFKYVNGRMVAMPLDKSRDLLFTQSITEDDNGFFWIPTNSGLFQCKKAELDAYAAAPEKSSVYYYYYRQPGKYTNEFNGGSNPAAVSFQGYLLLPTINGIIGFAPAAMRPTLPNRNVLMEDIKVDNLEIATAGAFEIPPYFKRLEFNISAPYMGDAMNNVLEYNLEENGNNWYPVVSGSIIFNQLPKGTYHLNIRKRTGFGINNFAWHKYRFTVLPFWYQTFWFLLVAVFASLAAVYYFVRIRITVLEKSKLNLEKMVSERTAELNRTIDELYSSEQHLNSMNEVQEKAIAIILHDIQSPIHYLAISAKYFDRQLQQLSPDEIKEFSANLLASATEINQLTNDLLQWLIVNQDNMKLQVETIDVPVMLDEVRSLYTEIVKFNGNTLSLKTEGSRYVFTDRNKLKLVIRNLVDNANKNTAGGEITLSCRYDAIQEQMIISVADTGMGMNADQVEQLQNSPADFSSFRKGRLGFAMVREFVQLMNGAISIESSPGRGTTVNIIISQ